MWKTGAVADHFWYSEITDFKVFPSLFPTILNPLTLLEKRKHNYILTFNRHCWHVIVHIRLSPDLLIQHFLAVNTIMIAVPLLFFSRNPSGRSCKRDTFLSTSICIPKRASEVWFLKALGLISHGKKLGKKWKERESGKRWIKVRWTVRDLIRFDEVLPKSYENKTKFNARANGPQGTREKLNFYYWRLS